MFAKDPLNLIHTTPLVFTYVLGWQDKFLLILIIKILHLTLFVCTSQRKLNEYKRKKHPQKKNTQLANNNENIQKNTQKIKFQKRD